MNYISVAGALHGLGPGPGRPHFPTNLLGDFGGGSTYLVIGVLAALLEARVSGQGQVVDAAIVDGTAHLNAMCAGMLASGIRQRAAGGEPARRRRALLRRLRDRRRPAHVGRRAGAAVLRRAARPARARRRAPDRDDLARSAGAARRVIAERFKERTQAEWVARSSRAPTPASPGSSRSTEAAEHPHLKARGDVRRPRRRRAARTGAALLAHRGDAHHRPVRARRLRPARRLPPGGSPTSTPSSSQGVAVQA